MSMPPPGHETPQASPPVQNGSRQADDNVQYDFKLVKALRGRESSAKAKWQRQGWELVSENRGTLRTELNFRRAKPKMIGDYLLSIVAGLRRLQPKTKSVLVASCALILVAGSVGIAVGTQVGGDTRSPTAATTAPPAEPTVTRTTDNELLDDAAPTETSKLRERRAKARAKARAREKRRDRALEQEERRRNTAQLQSGVTCAEIGRTDILVIPGAEIDGDEDGVGCES
jgi:hypothetical protein